MPHVVEIRGRRTDDDTLFDFLQVDPDGYLQLNGNSIQTHATPVVNTTPVASGDCYGGILTFPNAIRTNSGTGVLQTITVIDTDNVKPAMDVILFNSTPSAGTYTNNATPVFSTDSPKITGKVSVYASDYTTYGSLAMAEVPVSGRVLTSDVSNIYGISVTTAATTPTQATPVTIKLGILQD